MSSILNDVRFAVRSFRHSPGFTLAVLGTLAIVIAAATTIFAFVNAILLRPLPYEDPDRLVAVFNTYGLDRHHSSLSPPDYIDRRDLNRTFVRTAAYRSVNYNLTGDGDPQRLSGALVSAELFPLLGVSPIMGRTFSSAEDQPDAERVVVLSSRLWRERFGQQRDILGQTILLNDQPRTIIGVMPASFRFPSKEIDLWAPIAFTAQQTSDSNRGNENLDMIARLKPGVTIQAAQQDLNAIVRWAVEKVPQRRDYLLSSHWGAAVVPMREEIVGKVRPALRLLAAAVGVLMLIGCANVANLLLARATVRRKEILVRKALGAGAARIIRQLITESILLATAGGAAGIALCLVFLRLVRLLAVEGLPRLDEVSIDAPVLAFVLATSFLCAVLFGIFPALRAAKSSLAGGLKSEARGTGGSGAKARSVLVQVEVSLAVVLIIGGVLLVRSLLALENVAPGFDPSGVLTFRVGLPAARYSTSDAQTDFFERLANRLGRVPGVRDVGMTSDLPLSGQDSTATFVAADKPLAPGQAPPGTHYRTIAAGYFRAMGVPLVQGRLFEPGDDATAPKVVMVDRAIARMIWPGESAVGKRISFSPTRPNMTWREIVGVVDEVKHNDLADQEVPTIYFPLSQNPQSSMYIVVKQADPRVAVASQVREALRQEDPMLPLWQLQPMADYLSDSVARPRFRTVLLGSFAAIALFLSLLGIYALVSYTVQQSRREIGIRMALGASPRDVVLQNLRWGAHLMTTGLLLGVVTAFFLSRFLRSLLFGIGSSDPITYVVATLLFAVGGLAASYIPSRRAAKADPMAALRYE